MKIKEIELDLSTPESREKAVEVIEKMLEQELGTEEQKATFVSEFMRNLAEMTSGKSSHQKVVVERAISYLQKTAERLTKVRDLLMSTAQTYGEMPHVFILGDTCGMIAMAAGGCHSAAESLKAHLACECDDPAKAKTEPPPPETTAADA